MSKNITEKRIKTSKEVSEHLVVNIGVDVHRKSYVICCIVNGVVVKRCRMHAGALELIGFIHKHFKGYEVRTVYEAGFSGFGLHRALEAEGFKSIVVDAGSIAVEKNDRVKTDKRDALKMATQLSAGSLKGIRIPSIEEETSRLPTRTRQQLVEHRSAIKNQIRSKFHIFGLIPLGDDRELSFKMVNKILVNSQSEELRRAVEALVVVWRTLDQQIRQISRELAEQAKHDPRQDVYRSLPGFGPLASRVCSAEVGDLQQFTSSKKLYSFVGLAPGEVSSGEDQKKTGITKRGSARLRAILIQVAWRAVQKDYGLKKDFERIARNGNKLKAIVAIARKLIGRARALFRDGVKYDPQFGFNVA